MWNNHLFKWFYFVFIISFIMLSMIEGKGIGSIFRRGPSRSGSYGRPSGYHHANRYGTGMVKPYRSGNKLRNFAAGAAGAAAGYAIMRAITGPHHSRSHHYYDRGYGSGREVCVNNENLNGRVFGRFTCPLPGFPYDAVSCCGEYGRQYCCAPGAYSQYGI